jgi:uncharacterized membrane protein YccF (DUF307 family)
MRLVGNILWFLFGGVFLFLHWVAVGIAMCLTVIGIPWGLKCFELGFYCLMPFGKQVHERPRANSPLRLAANVVWILLFGWQFLLHHLFWALLWAVTIAGIPFALQHIKLIPVGLMPFGRTLE